jgi:hypothetical protein
MRSSNQQNDERTQAALSMRAHVLRRRQPDQGLAQLLPLLTHIDHLRTQLHLVANELFDKVNSNHRLFERYHRFLAQGGSTGTDLQNYLRSRPIERDGKIISRQHNRLRLISSTNQRRPMERDSDPDDNQAA